MKRFVLLFLFATFAAIALPKILAANETPASLPQTSCSDDCCDCPCQHCGCQAHCHKICHPVCEWKDVKETVYSCRCTDICIPGRSEKLCTKIDECNPDNCPLCHDYKPLYTLWNPAECARSRSVTKLYKHEVSHKVPTYRWVVEYCCDSCCNQLSQNTASPGEAGATLKPTITPGTTATQIAAAPKLGTSPQMPTQPQIAAAQQMPAAAPQIKAQQFAAQQPNAVQNIADVQPASAPQIAMQPMIPAQQGNIAQLAAAVQPPCGIQPASAAQPDSAVQPASAIQEIGPPREFLMISPPFPAANRK